jgi:hypothetical protein
VGSSLLFRSILRILELGDFVRVVIWRLGGL